MTAAWRESGAPCDEPEPGASACGSTNPVAWQRLQHVGRREVDRRLVSERVHPYDRAVLAEDAVDFSGEQQHVDQQDSIEGIGVEGQRACVGLSPGSQVGSMAQHACGQISADQRSDAAIEYPSASASARPDLKPTTDKGHPTPVKGIADRSCLGLIDMVRRPIRCQFVKQCRHALGVLRLPFLTKRYCPSELADWVVWPSERVWVRSVRVGSKFSQHPSSQAARGNDRASAAVACGAVVPSRQQIVWRPVDQRRWSLMDFSPNADHDAIREGIQRICADFPDEYWLQKDSDHEFPWDFYQKLAEGGWVGMAIPTEYGGGGQGITEASIMLEEIAASGAAMNGCSAVHLSVFGMEPVRKYGSAELAAEVLPRVASGELHVAFGVTEPDAGTDTTQIKTRAVRDGDEYVINGAKVWTTKAPHCEMCLLLVRTTPIEECESRTDGISLFLVDLQDPAVDITPISKLGRNAVVSCEVRYDNLRVPARRLIGDEGKGFRYILDGLNPERVLIASEALGIGRASIRRASEYAKDRIIFDRPIGQNQGIAFPLAEAHMKLRAAELIIRQASWLYDSDLPCAEAANTAKYLAAEAGFFAADRAMQTHGGFGYASEYHVERYWREARLMKIAPVSQEMVLNFISNKILGLPRSY